MKCLGTPSNGLKIKPWTIMIMIMAPALQLLLTKYLGRIKVSSSCRSRGTANNVDETF